MIPARRPAEAALVLRHAHERVELRKERGGLAVGQPRHVPDPAAELDNQHNVIGVELMSSHMGLSFASWFLDPKYWDQGLEMARRSGVRDLHGREVEARPARLRVRAHQWVLDHVLRPVLPGPNLATGGKVFLRPLFFFVWRLENH